MSIIQNHDITLYGGTDNHDIVLRPLCDEHLPFLYKWNTDPDVLYWSEGADVQAYNEETIHFIYGKSSYDGHCFLVEVDGIPVGECWLQKMNLKAILEQYPDTADVRRIDMMIGDKSYWNRGIGSTLIGMLVDFAFNGECVDALHGLVFDFNTRSQRVFEKNGFTLFMREPSTESPSKAKEDLHYRITQSAYIEGRRAKVPSDKIFEMPIANLQPSQLYVSEGKLRLARSWFDPADKSVFDPIPIKMHNNRHMMTDGHTRAALAFLSGWETIPVTWDEDEWDMLAYTECVRWCDEAGIKSAADLANRIISAKDYAILWNKRCDDLHKDILNGLVSAEK